MRSSDRPDRYFMRTVRSWRTVTRFFKFFHLAFDLVLGDAVPLLDGAGQLIATAFDPIEFIVGEFSPLFLHFSSELLPVTFHGVPDSLFDSSSSPC